jgi:hypothetical protein
MSQARAFTNVRTRIRNPKTGEEHLEHHPYNLRSRIQLLVELKNKKLHDEIEALQKRLQELEDDPIMQMVSAMAKQTQAKMRDRYIAAAKEKDPFLKAVKKPIVSDEELHIMESNTQAEKKEEPL